MAPNDYPSQYLCLFRLLRDCSSTYIEELAALPSSLNPITARLEVDIYLLHSLSSSLQGLHHNHDVWKGICQCIGEGIEGVYTPNVICDSLPDLIESRFNYYVDIVTEAKDSFLAQRESVKALFQHIKALMDDNTVEVNHPIVGGSIFKDTDLLWQYLRVDTQIGLRFSCAIKYICKATNDIRTLSEDRIRELAKMGVKEAAEDESEIVAAIEGQRLEIAKEMNRIIEEYGESEE